MRRAVFCILLAVLCLFLPLSACAPAAPEQSQTLLIYMCGSDLESRRGYASNNIADMLEARLPHNVNVVIQTGGANSWRREEISASELGRYEVRHGKLIKTDTQPLASMGDAETLASFLLYAAENYPAEQTSLILWDHGGGSVDGVCRDELFGDNLTLAELSAALAKAQMRFSFIGFDACLMATYETAHTVQDYADYLIASEELEPAAGWDYTVLLENLGFDGFYDDVLASFAARQGAKTYYTLSVTDLAQLSRVDEALDAIVNAMLEDNGRLREALADSVRFGARDPLPQATFFDIESFARCLGLECDFSGFVRTANGSARSGAGGLSFYFPSNVSADHSGYLDMYDGEEYTTFLREYLGAVPVDTISFTERGFIDGGSGLFGFSLDPACLCYVQSVQYEVHLYGEGSAEGGAFSRLYCIGTDNDVLQSGSRFLARFTGKWVYLDGILLHCAVLAQDGGLTVFYSPITVNGEFSYLLFRYSQAEGAAIEGVLDGDGSTARIRPLAEGDEIAVLYDTEQGEGTQFFEEGSIVYDAQTKLTVQTLPAGEYQIVPIVTDIYGNVFHAYTAAISFDGNTVTNIEISAG